MAISVFSLAPYHILSYGTLLGTGFFHTFVNSVVSIQTLQRPQFAQLQANLFPIYFSMQSAIPAILAFTYPALPGGKSGISGVLAPSSRLSTLAPLVFMLAAGLTNLLVVGPQTTKCMRDRRIQERKDGKRSFDAPPHSQEMQALNKRFGLLHGISSLINLGAFLSCVAYGFVLSSRIR